MTEQVGYHRRIHGDLRQTILNQFPGLWVHWQGPGGAACHYQGVVMDGLPATQA